MNHRVVVVFSGLVVLLVLLVAWAAVRTRTEVGVSSRSELALALPTPIPPPKPSTLVEIRAERFLGMTSDHEFNEKAPGTYLPITVESTDSIVQAIPVQFRGRVDQEERATTMREVREIAAGIVEALGLEMFDRIESIPIATQIPHSPFSRTLRRFVGHSPNYNWESINPTASFFRVYDIESYSFLGKEEDARYSGNPALKAIRDNSVSLISLRFQVGHLFNGENFIQFDFCEDSSRGLIHTMAIQSNLRTSQ